VFSNLSQTKEMPHPTVPLRYFYSLLFILDENVF
jgi:hypothetical protein